MSTESEAADRAAHAAANAAKQNLGSARGVRVSDGTEATPPERLDPFEARKAMFLSADAVRDAEAEGSAEHTLSAEQAALAEAMAAEAGATTTAPATGVDRTLHLPVKKESTQASQSANERVTVPYNGGQISVSRTDIDRAGGAELYVRQRQLDEQTIALAKQQQELQQSLADTIRLREELQRDATHRAGQGNDPAIRAADPAAQSHQGSGTTGVDDVQLAAQLAEQIYSGDKDDAAKALLRIIRLDRARGDAPDVTSIVKQVQAEMARTVPADGKQQTTSVVPPNPALEAVNRQINEMANREFADLMKNREAAAASFQRFLKLVEQPENKDRRAVDVAREACEQIEQLYAPARTQVVERKRGLPNNHAASGVAATSSEVDVPSDSEFVATLVANRAFGRRPQ